jgi:hypothetical protein
MMNSSCIIVVKIESNVVSYPLPRWIQIPIWWDISTFRTGFWCVTVSLVFLLLVGTCSHGFWWCFRSTWCENARKWKSCMWGINYVRCEILTFMIWATCECEYMKYEIWIWMSGARLELGSQWNELCNGKLQLNSLVFKRKVMIILSSINNYFGHI